MSKRLYIGNLPSDMTEERLVQAFAAWGVSSATVPADDGGRPKGFAFVDIFEDDQAKQAIEAMNGKDMDGRQLIVNEARPRVESGRSGGGRGGR